MGGYDFKYADHAKRLLRKGLSEEQAKQELVGMGISDEQATKYVGHGVSLVKTAQFELEEHRQKARQGVWVGAGLLAIGIVIAVLSGGAYVAWAVPCGAVGFVFSLAGWLVYDRFPGLAQGIEDNIKLVMGVGVAVAAILGIIFYIYLNFVR